MWFWFPWVCMYFAPLAANTCCGSEYSVLWFWLPCACTLLEKKSLSTWRRMGCCSSWIPTPAPTPNHHHTPHEHTSGGMTKPYEPADAKTLNKICATNRHSDQLVHLLSKTGVLVHPSLDSQGAVEGTCDQRRLWSDCTEAQVALSLRWSHKSVNQFCPAQVSILYSRLTLPQQFYFFSNTEE